MSEDQPPLTVLRRKAGARPGPPPPPRGMSPEKALRQALTKSAEGMPGLDLMVHDHVSSLADLAELLSQLPQIALFTLADGPGDGRGLICFGPELVDALIEVQTMGRVDKATRGPRATTRIDAALTRDFVETVLNDFAARVAVVADARWARGFKYGTYVPDPTPLPLMLEEGDYRLQVVTVDLGSGAKRSHVWFALPALANTTAATPTAPAIGHSPAEAAKAAKAKPPADPVWAARMRAAVIDAPVELRVTLTRMKLPLSRLQNLRVGDTIPISRGALGALEVSGAGPGQTLSGRLGQHNGMRAVRLSVTGPAREGTMAMPTSAPQPAKGAQAMFAPPAPIPDMPAPADLVGVSDLPDLPDLPSMGGFDTGPGGLPDLPDLPGLPDLPPLGGPMNSLPNLPNLPDLPDLPDLPSFT